MAAIAKHPEKFYSYLTPPVFKRSRTPAHVSNAISTVESYKYYRQITEEECTVLKREIKSAPHDDAISDIMTNLRKRVYG